MAQEVVMQDVPVQAQVRLVRVAHLRDGVAYAVSDVREDVELSADIVLLDAAQGSEIIGKTKASGYKEMHNTYVVAGIDIDLVSLDRKVGMSRAQREALIGAGQAPATVTAAEDAAKVLRAARAKAAV